MNLFTSTEFYFPVRLRRASRRNLQLWAAASVLLIATILSGGSVAFAASATPVNVSEAGAVVRIKAGIRKPMTDAEGKVWQPDQGFVGGVIADRDVIVAVANTPSPSLYRSEHYNMSKFTRAVPNGHYLVRLHFAEMFDGVTGAGQRLFSFNVAGHQVNDFDIWKAAGGSKRAYIETIKVEVTDGKLEITFTRNLQYPTINAIEIVPTKEG